MMLKQIGLAARRRFRVIPAETPSSRECCDRLFCALRMARGWFSRRSVQGRALLRIGSEWIPVFARMTAKERIRQESSN